MGTQAISQETETRKYFTMLPNLMDDSDLDPYEFRLLAHYYRVGNCYEGTRTTAEKCKMGVATVVDRRRSLAEKGWIRLVEPPEGDHQSTIKIVLIDRWKDNADNYGSGKPPPRSPDEHPVRETNTPRSVGEHPRSPDERKNNPIKNNKDTHRAREDGPEIIPTLLGADIDEHDPELIEMETILGQVVQEVLFYEPHHKRIRQGAKAILAQGYTSQQVVDCFSEGETYWYTASYGRKGENPWVANVVGEIATAVRWLENPQAFREKRKLDKSARDALLDEVDAYSQRRVEFTELSKRAQDIIHKMGGQSNVQGVSEKDMEINFYKAYNKVVNNA